MSVSLFIVSAWVPHLVMTQAKLTRAEIYDAQWSPAERAIGLDHTCELLTWRDSPCLPCERSAPLLRENALLWEAYWRTVNEAPDGPQSS